MGILSDLIRAPIGQAPSRGRGMGGLETRTPMPPRRKGGLAQLLIGAKDRAPMPPRRKGGLAGLLQRVKDKRLERPISIGGVSGGNIQPTQSPLQQAFEKIQNSIQPVPVLPGQQGMRFDPITRKMVPAEGPDTPPPGFIPPTIGNTGGIGRDMGIAPPTDDPFLRPRVDAIGGQQPIPQVPLAPLPLDRPILERPIIPPRSDDFMSIERIGDLPPGLRMRETPPTSGPVLPPGGPIQIRPDLISSNRISDQIPIDENEYRPIPRPSIGGAGGGFPPSQRVGEPSLTPFMPTVDLGPEVSMEEAEASLRAAGGGRGGRREPIPPQDFGFGPGIRPTEIRGPDGRIIGPAGVTPPDFVKNIENKGPSSLRDRINVDRFAPPKSDDFMSISGPRGGLPDPRTNTNIQTRDTEFGPVTISSPGGVSYLGGSPTFNEQGSVGAGNALQDFINNPPVTDPIVPTVDPVQPAPTEPAAVATTAGADPTQTQMPMGAIDPVLLQQQTSEKLTDPLLRSLYFGTQDSPGFYQQLQQAGANLIGSDVPLQQTAGLTPLEVLARQQAISGIGGFEPFLQQNQNLVNQAIDQSVRAEELRDPYYGRAERQMQMGLGEELGGIGQARGITTGATNRFGGSLGRLGRQAIGSTQDYGGSLGESEDLLRGTLGAYDPGMTQQFYNPYEDAVVQQTIDDVLEAGDKQDIAARAREISSGAFGGSRARLGAEERRQDLGEGLAKALSGIRQTGYSQAQQTGLSEFARQREAERAASSGLAGLSGSRLGAQQQLGSTLRGLTGDQFGAQQQLAANLMGYGAAGSGARQNLATGLLGIGQQRGAGASALGSQLAGYGSQIGGIGQTQEQMRAGQRGELAGYGGVGRGIAETGLSRIFEQQVGQQYRPMQTLGQIGSMLPGYQASQTQIDSGYGMPTDPTAAGLGAAFSAYGALAPRQEGQG